MNSSPSQEERRKVQRLAWEAVRTKQLDATLPEWILRSCRSYETLQQDGSWQMEAWLYRKWNLRPGEFWLREDGSKRLASRHPGTGEVRILLSYDQEPDAERVTLFIARVEPSSGHCELESLTDFNTLQPAYFELWE